MVPTGVNSRERVPADKEAPRSVSSTPGRPAPPADSNVFLETQKLLTLRATTNCLLDHGLAEFASLLCLASELPVSRPVYFCFPGLPDPRRAAESQV